MFSRFRTKSNDSTLSNSPLTSLPSTIGFRNRERSTATRSPSSVENDTPEIVDEVTESTTTNQVGDDHGITTIDQDSTSLFPRRRTSQDDSMQHFIGGGGEGGIEITYAELLGRDVRESILLHHHRGNVEEDATRGNEGEREGGEKEEEEETMLVLPGRGWAVRGPDAQLLLQELHQCRISLAQKRRRRISYIAGTTSLIVFIFNFYTFVRTCVSIVKYTKGNGRGVYVLRWLEFSVFLTIGLLWIFVFLFLRTRRPSSLGIAAIVSSIAIVSFHLSLALTNFILSFVWKSALARNNSSSTWDIDVAWANLNGDGGSSATKYWTIAAVVRFFIVLIIGLIWIALIRKFNKSLHIPFVISPHALPSSELDSLLLQHRAEIISIPSSHSHASRYGEGEHHSPNWLPSHLERGHYAQVSDASAAYSYVSRRMRSESQGGVGIGEERGEGESNPTTTTTTTTRTAWIGGKVWNGIGWLLGVEPSSQGSALNDGGGVQAGGGEKRFGEEIKVEEREEDRVYQRDDLDDPSFDTSPHQRTSTSTVSHRHDDDSIEQQPPRQLTTSWFERFFSSSSSKRLSTASNAPLLPSKMTSSSPVDPDFESIPLDASSTETTHSRQREVPPPPLPPKEAHPPSHLPRTASSSGSSGSTGGHVVYVRMSDGKLVRRLSTIASLSLSEGGGDSMEGSGGMGRRSRSDLSGGTSSGGQESFATARSRESSREVLNDSHEEEVLA